MRRLLVLACVLAAAVTCGRAASATHEVLLFATVGPGPVLLLQTPGLDDVKRIRAGRYYIVVRDRSIIRNFHLRGPGIDRRTPVVKVHAYAWHLRLRKGTYTFWSDPQGRTKKRFRVV